jgi:hypothetical protein
MDLSGIEPRGIASLVALAVGFLLLLAILLRARVSRHPVILYTCAAYMAVLHLVWITGLLTSKLFESGFATLELLTFPWSMAVIFNMSMAGFGTVPDLLLNYIRFVLGFGGLQCLLLTLFIWELRLRPARRSARRAASPSPPLSTVAPEQHRRS